MPQHTVRADQVRLCDRLVHDGNMLVTRITVRGDSVTFHNGEHRQVTVPAHAKTMIARVEPRSIDVDVPASRDSSGMFSSDHNQRVYREQAVTRTVWTSTSRVTRAAS